MPRKQRKRRQPGNEYHEGHRLQLKIGHDFGLFGGPAFGNDENLDREAALSAWEALRGEILAEHIAEHPCTRPWAWWHLEPRELRRRVDGGIHPCEDPTRDVWPQHADANGRIRPYYGLPCVYSGDDGGSDFEAVYESVAAYLLRLDLLTKAERKIVTDNPEMLDPWYGDNRRGF
jgi:hypothetical protein